LDGRRKRKKQNFLFRKDSRGNQAGKTKRVYTGSRKKLGNKVGGKETQRRKSETNKEVGTKNNLDELLFSKGKKTGLKFTK